MCGNPSLSRDEHLGCANCQVARTSFSESEVCQDSPVLKENSEYQLGPQYLKQ